MRKQQPEEIRRVYLFSGEVDVRRQAAVEEIVSQVLDRESSAFDLEEFDGDSSSEERILAAASMAPFTSERKVVVVDRVDRLSPEGQVRIAEFIPRLGQRSCLILLADEDDSPRKPRQASRANEGDEDEKPGKRKKGLQPELAKAVKHYGAVVNFGKMKADALAALLAKIAGKHGKKIEPRALQVLAHSLEANPATAEREIEKLAAYTGDSETVTASDVDAVVTKSPEDRIFHLIDAIAAGQSSRAICLLNETFAASAKPDAEVLRMLAMLGRHFRILYQVKFLKSQGIRRFDSASEEVRAVLIQENKHNPFAISDWQQSKFSQQADSFTAEELRGCLRNILSCELTVKGIGESESSPRLNLEMLVLKLSQPRGKSR